MKFATPWGHIVRKRNFRDGGPATRITWPDTLPRSLEYYSHTLEFTCYPRGSFPGYTLAWENEADGGQSIV